MARQVDVLAEKTRATIVGAGSMDALVGAILADGNLEIALVDQDQAHGARAAAEAAKHLIDGSGAPGYY